jgi:hypothetical protein
MPRTGESFAALFPLGIGALVAFSQFATDGQWTFAVLIGLVLPLGAAFEWRVQTERSEEAARMANRWVYLVSFALLAAGL